MKIELIQNVEPEGIKDSDIKLMENNIFMISRNPALSAAEKLEQIDKLTHQLEVKKERKPRLYPNCENSKLFVKLLGKHSNGREARTLTEKHIEIIKQMGIKVKIIKPTKDET